MKRVRKYHEPAVYQIRVEGVLDPCWSEWFEAMVITTEAEATLMTGPVRDQAALHGLLGRIRDLGLSILLVKRINGPFSDVVNEL